MTKLESIQAVVDRHAVLGMAIVVAAVDPEWGGGIKYIYATSSPMRSDGSPLDLSPVTQFEIASITKTFTATMYLDRIGGLDGSFKDQVTLPFPESVLNMPIQALSNYTSGFPPDNDSNFGIDARKSLKELCHWFNTKFPPENKPVSNCGVVYSYSNLAFDLLSFAALWCSSVNDDVLSMYNSQLVILLSHLSLTMPNTTLYEASMISSLPLGFSDSGPFPIPAQEDMYDPVSGAIMDFGSGSLVSTAEDMAQWLLWNMGQLGSNPGLALQLQQPNWGLLPYSGVDTVIVSNSWFLGQVPPNLGPRPPNLRASQAGLGFNNGRTHLVRPNLVVSFSQAGQMRTPSVFRSSKFC
ncbi:serine hydrolase domain-containing protein [Acidisoma silvae]|uniref:Beta-lactamase family protein n=1 Tax=Acidisoma silvae TaxID=2802396 RepID=A0A963YWU3_9PROT|nr:serine hydrolase domain-containing protein [Acidisoma silvae]MCB8877827.1 beta-lactamase family protein [Acidisoma silvae]